MADNNREGFTYYRSFYEAAKDLPDEEKKELSWAIVEYGLDGIEPSFENKYLCSIFRLIKPNIDSSIRKYDQRVKAASSTKSSRSDDEQKTKPSRSDDEEETETLRSDNEEPSRSDDEGGADLPRSDGGTEPETDNKNKNNNSNAIENNYSTSSNKEELYKDLPSDLVDVLNAFEEMREQMKIPVSNKARETILKKLHNYSGGDVETEIEIVNKSIVNNWKDIFPLNKSYHRRQGGSDQEPEDLPTYDDSHNPEQSQEELDEILRLMGKK